ncbi:0de90ca0-af9f-419f-8f3d-f0b7820e5136 [Thermothielavioides terrestris]|uniref:0de90ca0-af9f-419f-8f3d-f0b7820e5136 n=1 Tax=Thermothielavioides terrestris TaxID=2587410 RepID=A0A3S4AII5_9PEZI|nr:0de90ca0-af9f-419f-8f3d-f0b7820e5136 [Thermothielavioides terrestris]
MEPVGPGPAVPPSGSSPAEPPPDSGGGVMLSDVMGKDRSINLFAGFVRDVESAARRLDNSSQNTTVLAPLNSAVEKLPRKPWEDPGEYSALGPNAYEGQEGQDRAQRNLRRFVEAHLVPLSPWPAGEKVKPVGGDREIWWEEKDGTRLIQPGAIEVASVAGKVTNGQVWIIKSVRNYT